MHIVKLTLKQIMRAYAVVKALNGLFHLQCVLFAYREVQNETNCFTPVELYARHVRGPLYILTVYHVHMLKKWFERAIMTCFNVISSLANNDVHSKDNVMSDKFSTLQHTKS